MSLGETSAPHDAVGKKMTSPSCPSSLSLRQILCGPIWAWYSVKVREMSCCRYSVGGH